MNYKVTSFHRVKAWWSEWSIALSEVHCMGWSSLNGMITLPQMVVILTLTILLSSKLVARPFANHSLLKLKRTQTLTPLLSKKLIDIYWLPFLGQSSLKLEQTWTQIATHALFTLAMKKFQSSKKLWLKKCKQIG